MPETKQSYSEISTEIGQHIERLAAIELQAASVRQELGRLLIRRSEIEAELGVMAPRKYLAVASGNNSSKPKYNRQAAAELRTFWKANAKRIGLEYRTSGPIPDAVHQAYAKR